MKSEIMRKLIFILSSSVLFACSNQNIDGTYEVDIEKSTLDPKLGNGDVREAIIGVYKGMKYEIVGQNLNVTVKDMGSFKCNITEFDKPNGVKCQVDGTTGAKGETEFGLYKDGNSLYVVDDKNPRLFLKKVSKSSPTAQTTAPKVDAKLAVFQGKWAGAPAWECSESLVVEADGTVIDSGKKQLWKLNSDGDLSFEDSQSGEVYFLSPEKGKLYYSREGSGEDPIELSKCD